MNWNLVVNWFFVIVWEGGGIKFWFILIFKIFEIFMILLRLDEYWKRVVFFVLMLYSFGWYGWLNFNFGYNNNFVWYEK